MTRGAVIILHQDHVALICRQRPGQQPYYVFPGGKAEPGETPEQAALREAHEELGVHVQLHGLVAMETFEGSLRHYYRAVIRDGVFGTGAGAEMSSDAESPRGTYTPLWLPLEELTRRPVYPKRLVALLASGQTFAAPLVFGDDEPA